MPRPQGGDRSSGGIEAEAVFFLVRVAETPDVTLAELQRLLSARGVDVGMVTFTTGLRLSGLSAPMLLEATGDIMGWGTWTPTK